MVAESGRAVKAKSHDEVAGDDVGNRRTAWRIIASVDPKHEKQATKVAERDLVVTQPIRLGIVLNVSSLPVLRSCRTWTRRAR